MRKKPDDDRLSRIAAEALRHQEEREKTYRERALKIHPWVCAWCGREFSGQRLRELTVHHKDFNHENNPPDGSNWELLCIYCHEHVHSRRMPVEPGQTTPGGKRNPPSTYKPFADLKSLLNSEEGAVNEAKDEEA